jgi:hypothetical protein
VVSSLAAKEEALTVVVGNDGAPPELSSAMKESGKPHMAGRIEGQVVSRGTFLKSIGRGTALVAVAAGGVGVWRATDQGVFTTGEGPAYAAWNDWAGKSGGGPLNLVRAAILAANAHDSQPWLFHIGADSIDLRADVRRNLGTIDPLRREMHLSLGCALENLLLATAPHGYTYQLQLLPNQQDATQIATIQLRSGTAPISPLYAAIPKRHTNRGPYDTGRTAGAGTLHRLQALNTVPDIEIVWYASTAEKQAFSALTMQATTMFIGDRQQSIDDFAWWRGDWAELQRRKDGITLDAAGLSPVIRTLGKMLPPQTRSSNDQTWLDTTRNPQLSTPSAFGIIVARSPRTTRQWLEAGRLWQRMQLWATTEGLAMQPLNQTVERAEREQAAGLAPTITNGLTTLLPGPGWHAVMPFRIGYPTMDGLKSPRRPVGDVVV